MRPFSALEQRVQDSRIVIARFVYSDCGTQVARGAEVGDLAVFRDSLTSEPGDIDKLVCSFMWR
jgi:hypothetical protein